MPSSRSTLFWPSPKRVLTVYGMETKPTSEQILRFVSLFGDTREAFLDGMCYWFAYILQARFGGETFYDQLNGHFVQRINESFYDASGDVTEKYGSSKYLMRWSDMESYDPSLYRRLIRDCIKKERFDYDDDAGAAEAAADHVEAG